jgi:hypothetical protein
MPCLFPVAAAATVLAAGVSARLTPETRPLPSSSVNSPLQPLKWIPLPMGNVHPEGWLFRELTIQNHGMAGNYRYNWEP